MIELGKDGIFIVAAYAGVAVGVIALIAHAVVESRRVRAKLNALEARGVRRRSAETIS
jgi:heme exporter protein CcmD